MDERKYWTIVVVNTDPNTEVEPIVWSDEGKSPRWVFEWSLPNYYRDGDLPGVDTGLPHDSMLTELHETYRVVAAFEGSPRSVPVPGAIDESEEDEAPLPEPDRIPVEKLQGLAGRQVHFVGEFDDPWDVATRKVLLNDWREHYVRFGRKDKEPVENSYFGLSDQFDIDWPEAAERIDDLPVCFVMAGDMEMGLCPISKVEGWQWSLIEAFTRLGVLPPTNELYLPDQMDIPRSPELIRYLLEAFRAGVAHEVKVKQDLAVRTNQYLNKVADKVLASK